MTGSRRRTRSDSLAGHVVQQVERAGIPLPTRTVRTVIGSIRDESVSAEALARLAAYERDEFRRARTPPRLCETLDEAGRAVTPRRWARGSWQLRRRIAARDVLAHWDAAEATYLCRLIAEGETPPEAELAELCLEKVAAVTGLARAYLPTTGTEWYQLAEFVRVPTETWDPHAGTAEQQTFEAELLERASVVPFGVYFGIATEASELGLGAEPATVRRANAEDKDVEHFSEVVLRRLGRDADAAVRVLEFLDAWGRLRMTGVSPTYIDVAMRTGREFDEAATAGELFAIAFPEESDPARLVGHLMGNDPDSRWIGAVPVIDGEYPAVLGEEGSELGNAEKKLAWTVRRTRDFDLADQASSDLAAVLDAGQHFSPTTDDPEGLIWWATRQLSNATLRAIRAALPVVAAGYEDEARRLDERVLALRSLRLRVLADSSGEVATTVTGQLASDDSLDAPALAELYDELAADARGNARLVFQAAKKDRDSGLEDSLGPRYGLPGRRSLYLYAWVASDAADALSVWGGAAMPDRSRAALALSEHADHLAALQAM